MWHITPERTDEMIKKIKRKEILNKYLRQLVEKVELGNGQK